MYTIGQVLFVVLAKKNQVYPMQIIEVITKKTLRGEEIKYLLQAGSDKKTTVMLDEIDGEVFESAEKVRTVLAQRASSQINKLVQVAVQKSQEWYDAAVPPQSINDLPDLDVGAPVKEATRAVAHAEADDEMKVMLPDGTLAKVKLPEAV